MGDELSDLLALDPVGERALEVAAELVAPAHGHQRGDRDEAAVALGQAGTLPHVPVQDGLAQLDQLGGDGAHLVAGGRRSRRYGSHWVAPFVNSEFSL